MSMSSTPSTSIASSRALSASSNCGSVILSIRRYAVSVILSFPTSFIVPIIKGLNVCCCFGSAAVALDDDDTLHCAVGCVVVLFAQVVFDFDPRVCGVLDEACPLVVDGFVGRAFADGEVGYELGEVFVCFHCFALFLSRCFVGKDKRHISCYQIIRRIFSSSNVK